MRTGRGAFRSFRGASRLFSFPKGALIHHPQAGGDPRLRRSCALRGGIALSAESARRRLAASTAQQAKRVCRTPRLLPDKTCHRQLLSAMRRTASHLLCCVKEAKASPLRRGRREGERFGDLSLGIQGHHARRRPHRLRRCGIHELFAAL